MSAQADGTIAVADSGLNQESGSVHLFSGVDGQRLSTLNNPDSTPIAQFGVAIAPLGNNLIVGAPHDSRSGAPGDAYLVDLNGNELLQIPGTFGNEKFGHAVAAIHGNILVANGPSGGPGRVRVFDGNSGALLLTIADQSGQQGTSIGFGAAELGSDFVIAAAGTNTVVTNAGIVYVYNTLGQLLLTLNNPNPQVRDAFGTALAVSGNRVLIGAPASGEARPGLAYMVDGTSGQLTRTFQSPTPDDFDQFGQSIAVNGSHVLIGAPGDDTSGPDTGTVYVFDADTGALVDTIVNPTPSVGLFGQQITARDSSVLIRALAGSGVVHLFVGTGSVALVIDEDSIDNGTPPNYLVGVDINDDIADIGLRDPLPAFSGNNVGTTLDLYTGEVGDEGWFALTSIPESWDAAGPTNDGLKNFIQGGPGLGSPDANGDREALLDKVPNLTALRATGLAALQGQRICAVVFDSDISINYDPLNASLKGANLGVVALKVLDVKARVDGSSSALPIVTVVILDALQNCQESLILFEDAPTPTSSSEPFDVVP